MLISWLAEDGYHVGVVRQVLSARKMLVETAFSSHSIHIVDTAEISGLSINYHLDFQFDGYSKTNMVVLPSETVLAYHLNRPRLYPQQLSSTDKVWSPLIMSDMVGGAGTPVTSYPPQQLPSNLEGEEFYRGHVIDAFSDGLRVVKVNAVGNGEEMLGLQEHFYVLVRNEHLGYSYKGNMPNYWIRRGGHYDQHGQNLALGNLSWHEHEAAAYLTNYGKQRFFGIKGNEEDIYAYNRNYLSAQQYDGVFVLYAKNGNMQVGLANLIEPELLQVQQLDGTSETLSADAIQEVLVLHHPDYASNGKQVSIAPADFQALNRDVLSTIVDNNDVFEDDMLLGRVVLVLTGGWRVVEVSSAQEEDGAEFPLETPLFGLANTSSWSTE